VDRKARRDREERSTGHDVLESVLEADEFFEREVTRSVIPEAAGDGYPGSSQV
jgi:hypothetical protein